jgi:hypothetical protein
MPINRKNEAKPRVTKSLIIEPQTKEAAWSSPAERPSLDERSVTRAKIAAVVAETRAELRSGPAAELIREVEDEMEHPRDRRREYEEKVLERKRALKEKKNAARLERMGGPLLEIKD